MTPNLYIGTIGQGVWFSDDLGKTVDRAPSSRGQWAESGIVPEARIWALSFDPSDPTQLLAGTGEGIFRLDRKEPLWHHISSGIDKDLRIWTITQSPVNPKLILAGTHPASLFRSEDGGKTWKKSSLPAPEHCEVIVNPRVTSVRFDPQQPDHVWLGLEIGGLYLSKDAGRTFHHQPAHGLLTDDVHDIAIVYPDGKRRILVTTNMGVHESNDDGATFTHRKLDSDWQYTRAVVPHPTRPGVIFLTNGDGAPGATGTMFRSKDYGATWQKTPLPGRVNSSPWSVALHPADPDLVFTATNLGQLFKSTDGGDHWSRIDRELGEIRTVAWMPAL